MTKSTPKRAPALNRSVARKLRVELSRLAQASVQPNLDFEVQRVLLTACAHLSAAIYTLDPANSAVAPAPT